MILPDDKKKRATIIVARMKKPNMPDMPDMQSESEPQEDNSVALESAADELIAAIQRKDVKGVVESLKSFMEMCDYEPESENESETEQKDTEME